MQFRVDGHDVGSSGLDDLVADVDVPLVVFVHGAGHDHTTWDLQRRALRETGYGAVALDLPGHGDSAGAALPTIAQLADWLARAIGVLGRHSAHLCGHSMGSLIALESASRRPDLARSLTLLGTASAMPVHPKLLAAAQADDPLAIDLIVKWSRGAEGAPTSTVRAPRGRSRAEGAPDPNRRMLERARPGVLATDLVACAEYAHARAAARTVDRPCLVIAGSADRMTPPAAARDLADALVDREFVELSGVGHNLMTDAPDVVNETIAAFLDRVESDQTAGSGGAFTSKRTP
jgi:pimeloyl-ACP methyl ester carboxylesterase